METIVTVNMSSFCSFRLDVNKHLCVDYFKSPNKPTNSSNVKKLRYLIKSA